MNKNIKITVFLFFLSFNLFSEDSLKNFDLPVFGKDERLSLDSIKADKIVINFFASWCTACMKEIPELNSLKDQTAHENVVFVAINANEKDFKIAKFLKKTNFKYLILKDPGLSYSLSIGVEELPRTIILDNNKKVIYSSALPPSKI